MSETPLYERNECLCGCGGKTSPNRRFIHGHNRRRGARFFAVEDRGYESPCWVWMRSTNDRGYASYWVPHLKRTKPGHRYFYRKHKGEIPTGKVLDHLCRVRACVNPDHLEPVSHTENVRRGRVAKLSMEKAREIRKLAGEGRKAASLAIRYGVKPYSIYAVLRGKTWRESEAEERIAA